MKLSSIFIIVALLSLVTGCCEKVDIEQVKAQLMAVDRAFSEASSEMGAPDAFEKFMADNATLLRDNSYPITGSDAIAQILADWPPDATLTWEPEFAEVSSSADMGYTVGEYLYTDIDSLGNEISGRGYYVTIWKKQADGEWKYVLDAGTEGVPEEGEEE